MQSEGEVCLLVDNELVWNKICEIGSWKVVSEKPYKKYQHCLRSNIFCLMVGVGKTNAAAASQYLLDTSEGLQRVVNMGLCGGIDKTIKVGEVREIAECGFWDIDLTALGLKFGQAGVEDSVSYKLKTGGKYPTASLVSGDAFVTNADLLKEKIEKVGFTFQLVDTELAAIARVFSVNGKLEILESYKALSDYADASAANDYFNMRGDVYSALKLVVNSIIGVM